MAEKVVIVESPTKAKTLKKLLGKGYEVLASNGHVRDLPKSKLGIDIEAGFQPNYTKIRGKEKVLKKLRDAAAKAKEVLIATDPDREGEAIGWHLCEVLKLEGRASQRILINEFTPAVVRGAVENPTTLDMSKVNSQQARRILDRLVGYQISPLLWERIQRGLSAGRVQSVALRLICQRDEEIRRFVPEEYWSLGVDFARLTEGKEVLETELKLTDGAEAKISSEDEMTKVVQEIEAASPRVRDVATQRKKDWPQAPFITSTLQQAASRRLNMTAKATMRVAQQLYEGVELGSRGTLGLITYMRTDSTRVSPKAQEDARQVISTEFRPDLVPSRPPTYRAKKGKVQDAHEAIRPSEPSLTPDEARPFLTEDQYRLYTLIWVRFLASQMKPAQFDQSRIDVEAGRHILRATGRQEVFDGYLAAHRKYKIGGKKISLKDLPRVKVGEDLQHLSSRPEQHFTQPPPAFNEASLVKELEENGIGRPSTYATIISTLLDRGYVERQAKNLVATDLGRTVTEMLLGSFQRIMDVGFTAGMEEELDDIEQGGEEWKKVLERFYGGFEKALEEAREKMRNLRKEVQETDIECEKCGKMMVIRRGRYGKFLACPGFPDCRNTKKLDSQGNVQEQPPPKVLDETCEKCGKSMTLREGRFGQFKSCSDYPTCKFTRPVTLGIKCPEKDCKGEIVARVSKKKRTFYGCTEYPTCPFTLWAKPVGESCPDCGSALVEKRARDKLEAIVCSKKGCGYRRALAGGENSSAEAVA